jgi:hypothetical protein
MILRRKLCLFRVRKEEKKDKHCSNKGRRRDRRRRSSRIIWQGNKQKITRNRRRRSRRRSRKRSRRRPRRRIRRRPRRR